MSTLIEEHTIRIAVVTPEPYLDVATAPQLQTELFRLLEEGRRHLVVDLSAVTFCDSAALAVLVRTLRRVRAIDGSLSLVRPQTDGAQRIFSLTKFDQVFAMFPTVAAARLGFGGAGA